MATISNVHLAIEHGGGGNRRDVSVSYDICFNECEMLSGSVFVENVSLRGDDPIWDDQLVTLRNSCIKASDHCIRRNIKTSVSRNTLDEDGDTVIFGIPIFAARDEIYARITLTPYVEHKTHSDSNIVTGQFGAAGHD